MHMKKALAAALVLCLMLCLGLTALAEENNSVEFDAALTGIADQTATAWYSTGRTRALLSLLLSLDLSNALPSYEAGNLATHSSYVGYHNTSSTLCVVLSSDEHTYFVLYNPSLKLATYMENDPMSDIVIELVLGQTCDKYEENSLSDIADVVGELSEALE